MVVSESLSEGFNNGSQEGIKLEFTGNWFIDAGILGVEVVRWKI